MSGPENLTREIVWYHKDSAIGDDKPVGSAPLRSLNLQQIQRLWNLPEGNPMFDSFEITATQAGVLQKLYEFQFDFEKFDYFLETSADD